MRRGIAFLSLFLLLLLAPFAARYVQYYGLAGNLLASRQVAPDYDLAGIAQKVPTPVAGTFVDDPQIGSGLVLLDRAHNNDFTMEELSYLEGRLTARGFQTLAYQGGDLAGALRPVNAFVVIAPLSRFSRDETQAVLDFVNRGGRLLLVGDPTRFAVRFVETDFDFTFQIDSDRLPLNSLAGQFDIIFNGDYLYNTVENEGNFRNILLQDGAFAEESLTEGLDKLAFYGSHSLTVGPGGRTLLNTDDNTWSSATDRPGGLAVAALGGNGRVLALGDFTFLTEPYYTVFDNAQFAARIADFLTESDVRGLVLADFPYFYQSDIDLIYTGTPDLGPDAFDEIIALQGAFRRVGKGLSLTGEPRPGRDTLYLGLYNQAEEIHELLAAAGVELIIDPPLELESDAVDEDPVDDPKEPEDVDEEEGANGETDNGPAKALRQIKSTLGNVQMSGTSLILLDESDGRRNVIVLAASKEGLENTIGRLLDLIPLNADYALVGCFLQDNIALCPSGVADEPVEAELETGGAPEEVVEDDNGRDEENADTGEIDADFQGNIALGQTVEATLDSGQSHAWTFNDGPARIDITLQGSADMDSVLELYDPDHNLVDAADRTFSGGEERLAAVNIPDSRTYTIVVYDFFDGGGVYSLTVETAVADEIDAEFQGDLTLDEPVNAVLAAGEAHAWTFQSAGSAIVDITVEGSGDMDAVLELYDPDSFLIERVDNTLSGQVERLQAVEIGSGEYTVVVRDYFDAGGDYSLIVELGSSSGNGANANGAITSVFIFAQDDGVPGAGGFTSASALATALGNNYEVTVWLVSEDGPLQFDSLDGYDLVIWDSGDYRQTAGFSFENTLIILGHLEEGGSLFITGATPPLFEPADLSSLVDLSVAGDDPILLAGLTAGDVIQLDQAYNVTTVEDSLDDLDEGEVVFLIHGPNSSQPGTLAGLAASGVEDTDAKIAVLFAPFVALPGNIQTILLANLMNWFGS